LRLSIQYVLKITLSIKIKNMKKPLLTFFSLLCFGLVYLKAQNIVFPAEAEGTGWIDVTKAPYNAPNNGIGDATAALNAALVANIGTGKRIYLPNGTYLITNSIVWPNQANGSLPAGGFLQGQSRTGVIIKLKNNCPGFTNAAFPKAMIVTGRDPAQNFGNCIKNITINSGKRNKGAIALRYYANNTGTASDINIVSGDGQGIIGLDLSWQNENGPLLVKNIQITGFNIGINAGSCQNSQTLENVTLINQLVYGIKNAGILSIHALKTNTSSTSIFNSGVFTLVGAKLFNGMDTLPAIINSGTLYVRTLKATGYNRGIDNTGGNRISLAALKIAEWHSHNQISLNTSLAGMLKLPIKETPDVPWDSATNWQVVNTPGDGVTEASDAIQAAIDAGKTTVYMLPGNYKVTKPIYVRGNVRKLFGFGCYLDVYAGGGFVVQEGTSPTVVFDNWGGGFRSAFFCTQASSRTVVIKNCINWGVKKLPATGDLFLEDVCANPFTNFEFYGGNVWARQLNPESRDRTKIISSDTNLWILGMKTEWGQGGATIVDTKNGGKTELCGFFSYNITSPDSLPMFIVNESKFSAVGVETTYDPAVAYRVFVKETIGGLTKILGRDSLPGACAFGKILPYYVSNTVGTTIPVTGINVTPDTVKLQVNKSIILTGTVLPTNATNKTVIWSSSDTALAKVDILTGVVTAYSIGTAIIRGNSQDGNFMDSTIIQITPIGLTGSVTTSSAPVNLTQIGTADWAHWPGYDHKINGGGKISNYTVIGPGTPLIYPDAPRAMSWTDGTPTSVSNNNTSGNYIPGVGSGFSISIPADTINQTFILYASLFAGEGRFTAQLSDSSSPDYADESISGFGVTVDANYTINFKAASPNQTLTVTWILKNGGGNIALNGAALIGGITSNQFVMAPVSNNTVKPAVKVSPIIESIEPIVESIKVYPNPASSFIQVIITAPGKNDKAELMLCDVTGKTVYKSNMPSFVNQCVRNINCTSITKGIYFLKVNGLKLMEPVKVIIQ
jgi:Pectate lyase superfamily protein/Bacterial Ig-like domain (group 2)/Secretion system C-terminal sorting domain